MLKQFATAHRRTHRKGAMLVLIVVLLVAFFAAVCFTVDVAYQNLVIAELHASTDAAAKAAVGVLTRTEDPNAARQAAIDIAAANTVAGEPLILEASDIEFGAPDVSGDGTVLFRANQAPFSAARILGRRTSDSQSGSVNYFFAPVLGTNFFESQIQSTATRKDRDIALVLDRSGSMAGQKILDLKAAVNVFLAELDATVVDEFVGLASYSTSSTLDEQLTDDLEIISIAVGRMVASGFTNIGGGIDDGRRILERGRGSSFVEKTMIVMTDGRHNTGTDPIRAARRAADDGFILHSITFGGGADQSRMRQVAEIGSGTFNHAPNGAELIRIFRDIARTISTTLTD